MIAGSALAVYRRVRDVIELADGRHIGMTSAGVAFFAMLSLFPALAALVAIWGMVADPIVVSENLQALSEYLPDDAYELVAAQVGGLVLAGRDGVSWATVIGLGTALLAARAGVSAIVAGINTIFGCASRPYWLHQALSILLTIVMLAAVLVALAAGIVLPVVFAFVPLGPAETAFVTVARWSIAPLITVLSIGVLYRYGPNLGRDCRPRLLSPGLVIAVALWLAASEGFSLYLLNFGNYNKIYGSIGAVAALMMWFYLSAFAILLGAAVNAERQDRRIKARQTDD